MFPSYGAGATLDKTFHNGFGIGIGASNGQSASGGLAWLVSDRDLLGTAVGVGHGSDSRHDVQSVIEGFYRWQLREGIQITPDLQVLAGEGFIGSPGVRVVLGLRAGIQF